MIDHSKYNEEFYKDRDSRTRYAARRIIGHVMKLVKPARVVDLGCGVGTWLDVCKEFDVERILGLEGPWVDQSHLVIGKDEFLSAQLDKPLELNQEFDLAISLEVAEHIPGESANTFVSNLTKLAPVVLFSAAVPLQGGRNHVNEQWPSYWREKFRERGYECADAIRTEVWDDHGLDVWYAQNCFLYVDAERTGDYPLLSNYIGMNSSMVDAVHPRMFERKMRNYSLSKWFKNKMGRL